MMQDTLEARRRRNLRIRTRLKVPKVLDYALDGVVVNPEVARNTACTCYTFKTAKGGTGRLCFSKGIIGALTEDQIKQYCPVTVDVDRGSPLSERVEKFSRAAHEVCAGKPLPEFLECMSRELGGEFKAAMLLEGY